MKYIKQFSIIMAVVLLGELVKYLLPLPIPGSIYGLIILFLLLLTKRISLESVKETGEFLVSIMPIMFVPAAVGLMESFGQLMSMIVPVVLAVVPLTLLVMVIAGKVTGHFMNREVVQDE